jgi:pyridine nucleotide-disulfide oxidoreductase family protein
MFEKIKHTMHRLILVGGGHAQLSVLRALADKKYPLQVTLVSPNRYQLYSGMLPGWIAGHYSLEQCQIDLKPLAEAANAQLILSHVININANEKFISLANGNPLAYDQLSLDVGSETNISWADTADARLLPIKPLENFVSQWPKIMAAAAEKTDYQLAIVGGGAAGVELAFAARHAFNKRQLQTKIMLVASDHGLLAGHAEGVKQRAENLLSAHGIHLHKAHAVMTATGLSLNRETPIASDCVIAATGACAPAWLANTGLSLNEQGYVLVDKQQRSISHPDVFAAGDVCVRKDMYLQRSGVHAVFSGPVLANNLLAQITGQSFDDYRPRKKSLYLLATGPKHAIASWGNLSAHGGWVWRWKNWIDQGFIARYRFK